MATPETGWYVIESHPFATCRWLVTDLHALPNMYVQPETRLYTVADLSTIWVKAQVFRTDLGKIRPGNPAEVTVDAYPGSTFEDESILSCHRWT
jgi:multidrug efflux pump subunit AcrA (membrane-fusion protein)